MNLLAVERSTGAQANEESCYFVCIAALFIHYKELLIFILGAVLIMRATSQ
jgi:hypothetical protein